MNPITPGVLTKNLQVTLEGRGDITLRPTDHIATGGEGSIYKPSPNTIVKIYADKAKIVQDSMVDKIHLLSRIQHPYIVSPKGIVYKNHTPIGFYMNTAEGEPLARVFTTSYRQRENFTDKDAIALVSGMRNVVLEAHKHKATLVDANEFNWLVSRSKGTVEPRIIDVDSWAIDRWKPTVIMPSIRDWHTPGFNHMSDWFSFAVVTFQVFTGIHPYKGTLPGYAPNDIEKRMKDNASVFTKGIRLNSAVRDLNLIPGPLKAWYEQVFQNGLRSIPPSPKDKSSTANIQRTIQQHTITSSNTLLFDILYNNPKDTAVHIYPCGIVRLASGALYDLATGTLWNKKVSGTCEAILTEYGYLVAELQGNKPMFSLLQRDKRVTVLPSVLETSGFLRSGNRLFTITESSIIEISVKDFGKPILVTKNSWQIMGKSTNWFAGVGIQNSLGAMYMVLPFGDASCTYASVPSLKGLKIVDALAGARYVLVMALDPKSGQYYKYTYCFDSEYKTHQYTRELADTPDLNMAILPKGVCASIADDGELAISVPLNGQNQLVTDKNIRGSFELYTWENKIVSIYDGIVRSIRMKTP